MSPSPRLLLRGVVGVSAVAFVALLVPAQPAAAHDVPDELVFNAHVAPEADRLHVPLRVPLVWLLDYGFPKRGPGYIDLADSDGVDAAVTLVSDDLLGDIALFEDGVRLQPRVAASRLSLPSDRSFDDYHQAIAGISGPPLPSDTNLFWNQGYLDVHITYPIEDEASTFSILVDEPALAERLHIIMTFVAPTGDSRTYDLLGTMGRVELNPGLGYLLRVFATAGFTAALTGWENVLFVAALALALARRTAKPLRPVATFGAVVALIVLISGSTAGVVGLNAPFARVFVGVAAAASLVVVAVGNIMARDLRFRWLVAAVCAVPHGLLLAGGLEMFLQFRDSGGGLPLVAFTGGVLVGIAVVFGAVLGVGWLVARHAGARRYGPAIAALLIGYVGWRDTLERGEALLAVPPPEVEPTTLLGLGRWAAVVMVIVAAVWLTFELYAGRREEAFRPVAQLTLESQTPSEGERADRESVDGSDAGSTQALVPAERSRDNGTES